MKWWEYKNKILNDENEIYNKLLHRLISKSGFYFTNSLIFFFLILLEFKSLTSYKMLIPIQLSDLTFIILINTFFAFFLPILALTILILTAIAILIAFYIFAAQKSILLIHLVGFVALSFICLTYIGVFIRLSTRSIRKIKEETLYIVLIAILFITELYIYTVISVPLPQNFSILKLFIYVVLVVDIGLQIYIFFFRKQIIKKFIEILIVDFKYLFIFSFKVSLLNYFIYYLIVGPIMGFFVKKTIYLKGNYCCFLKSTENINIKIQSSSIEDIKIHWCELKNSILFWRDSQNIYVYLEKYNKPLSIKREYVLHEPIIGRKKTNSQKQTEQSKSTTKGENKNISQKVQPQNKTDS